MEKQDEIRKFDWVITDRDEMMLYAGLITQLGAGSVLDAGLFMQRIGAVSREFEEFSFPEETMLYGIDLIGKHLPIYDAIYQEISSLDAYQAKFGWLTADLGIILDVSLLMDAKQYLDLWNFACMHAKYILTDDKNMTKKFGLRSSEVDMGKRIYYLIMTNENA